MPVDKEKNLARGGNRDLQDTAVPHRKSGDSSTSVPDARLLELWRSVQGPYAELTGPLIRFAAKVREERTPGDSSTLAFDELQETNRRRCEQAFHSVDEWKPWEWSNAMAGEVGEACAEGFGLLTTIAAKAGACCNVTKKMARIWPANQFKQNWNKPEDQRMAELEEKLADELADVVIYADLLATRIGRNLGDCVRKKFNEKSDEIGSPVKLSAPEKQSCP